MNRSVIPLQAAILSSAAVVGKKEHEGPLGEQFDLHDPTCRFGKQTWEGAESEMQRMAFQLALAKGERTDKEVDAVFAGDLLNQCVGSAYGLLSYDIPYFGLYGACSTSAEALMLASLFITSGAYSICGVVTSSHYCSAERQYRTPLEYGSQRPPTAQWTVTGSGAFLLGSCKDHPHAVRISAGIPGKAGDFGINDPNNMGAAMAPAAMDTLIRFFEASGKHPEQYDHIITGDLGFEGGDLLCDLMKAKGYEIRSRYNDCGRMIFHRKEQDVHSGGSGCGCSSVVLSAHILPKLQNGEWNKILFLATGAMMSPDSIKQGENIPAIAHLLELSTATEKGDEPL